MTISTTAHTRAFFMMACLQGGVVSGCQAEPSGDPSSSTVEATVNDAPARTPGSDKAAQPGSTEAPTTDPSSAAPADPPQAQADSGSPDDDSSAPPSEKPARPSTRPSAPMDVRKNQVVAQKSSKSTYYVVVPGAYDASHATPNSLFVWLHGCGGTGANDAEVVSPGGAQSWITVSVGGRDGGCWNMDTDDELALAALEDVKTRLNIDPERVTIGGYSSGGNLAYRTAFYHAELFAGVLAENSAPFYGTDSSQAASIGAAAWKLNIVHLAHVGDTTFPVANLRREIAALAKAGFPATLLERPGTHWDSNTNADLRTYLLPYLDAGWRSCGGSTCRTP